MFVLPSVGKLSPLLSDIRPRSSSVGTRSARRAFCIAAYLLLSTRAFSSESAERCESTFKSTEDITMRVGVVGAGVSGLVVADRLRRSLGKRVDLTVFEWGRGPGGRTARRRISRENGTELSFDHAAPFFGAKTDAFRSTLLDEWETRGVVRRWSPRQSSTSDEDLWVGVPANNAICRMLASDLEKDAGSVLYGRHVHKAEFVGGNWRLTVTNRLAQEAKEMYSFDALVLSDKLLAQPGQQYCILSPTDVESAKPPVPASLRSEGQIVLLLAFSARLPTDLDFLRPVGGPLSFLVRDSSKPQRSPELELWTARSTAEFAALHLDGDRLRDAAAVERELREAFFEALGIPAAEPVVCTTFAWDHAQPVLEDRFTAPFSLDPERLLGICGDFYGAAGASGVEAAAISAVALSNALLKQMSNAKM